VSTAADTLHELVGINNVRPPNRRARRCLLVVSEPPRRLRDLTDSEIEGRAGRLVDGMAEQVERPEERSS
jgi:hypothetical protein